MKIENQKYFSESIRDLDIEKLKKTRHYLENKKSEADREDKLLLVKLEIERKIKFENYMRRILG